VTSSQPGKSLSVHEAVIATPTAITVEQNLSTALKAEALKPRR